MTVAVLKSINECAKDGMSDLLEGLYSTAYRQITNMLEVARKHFTQTLIPRILQRQRDEPADKDAPALLAGGVLPVAASTAGAAPGRAGGRSS